MSFIYLQTQVNEVQQWAELLDGGRNQNCGYLGICDDCRRHGECFYSDVSIVRFDLCGGYVGVFTTYTHKFMKLYIYIL